MISRTGGKNLAECDIRQQVDGRVHIRDIPVTVVGSVHIRAMCTGFTGHSPFLVTFVFIWAPLLHYTAYFYIHYP